MQIFDMLRRARASLPLTPGERALLKLLQGLVLAGVVAALLTAGHALDGSGPVDWRQVAFAAGVAALVAVLSALAKFYRAQGDAPLGAALASLADTAGQRAGQNAAKTPIIPPPASAREG